LLMPGAQVRDFGQVVGNTDGMAQTGSSAD